MKRWTRMLTPIIALVCASLPAAAKEAPVTGRPSLLVTFQERETFGVTAEAWFPSFVDGGYWSSARFGLSLGLDAPAETKDGERRHVRMMDFAAGYAIDSQRGTIGHLRSTFLAGGTSLDRHPKGGDAEPDPTSFGFFDTRQGLIVEPATHEAGGPEGDPSLLEIGVGFRWNFIGGNETLAAGDTEIREMQVYPYLAAHMPF